MTADRQCKLDAFLVENPELEELNARLAAFNLFRVLRVERAEIRHSNVLAWLLSPAETHGLGDLFLRRFLSRLLLENEEVDVSLTPAQVELMEFNDVEVLREWKSIDVLARSRRDDWCLLIENKIGSREKKGALARYKEAVRADMPSAQIIPVLLTVEGEEPSEPGKQAGYIALSHAQVLELAERIVEQNRARIPADANVFLTHYLEVLRRITMQDEPLVELCKTIYRKHREAIDLIVEYGTASGVLDTCEEVIPTLVDCEFFIRKRGRIWFLPTAMSRLPDVSLSDWGWLPRQTAMTCWGYHWQRAQKLGFALEVGPILDYGLRKRLLKALRDAGFSIRDSALKEGAKFTRITTKFRKLRTTEDGAIDDSPDYISELTRSLWETFWGEANKITKVLKNFDWKQKS